jgi:cephalosporin-C deacetylase-like acetyl esterase
METLNKHLVSFLAALAAFAVFANAWDDVQFKGRTDKANPVGYASGEPIVFTLVAADVPSELENAGYFVDWKRTGDDGKVETGRSPFKSGDTCKVTTSLDRPGFVRLEAHVVDTSGKRVQRDKTAPGAHAWQRHVKGVFFDGGAGVDVAKIEKFTPEPEDFDEWWSEQKKLLATVSPKATLKDVKTLNGVRIYELYVDCFGPRPVSGYLFVPENATLKSCGARCAFQGYGFYKQGCPEWAAWSPSAKREIFLEINAHGYELGREQSYYDEFGKGIHPQGYDYAFSPNENAKPETAYFRFMAMRVMRALEYVKSRPEWNGRDLIVEGGSQGGLQTSWAAGLDNDVSLARPSITWGCDYSATEPGGRLHGTWFIKYAPGLEYFDAISHIRRAKCPVEITRAGLGDYTCPPSGLAAYFNAIKTPKSILWVQGSTHGLVPPQPNQTYKDGDFAPTGGESKSQSASSDVK